MDRGTSSPRELEVISRFFWNHGSEWPRVQWQRKWDTLGHLYLGIVENIPGKVRETERQERRENGR